MPLRLLRYRKEKAQANLRFSFPYFLHAASLALAGRVGEARPILQKLQELAPNYRIAGVYEFGVVPTLADKLAEGGRLLGLPE